MFKPRKTVDAIGVLFKKSRIKRHRDNFYNEWFHRQEPSVEELERQATMAFDHKPLISILLPAYNTDKKHLRQCIESVIAQTYSNWELSVVDDASPEDVVTILKEYAEADSRVKWKRSNHNMHIAGASNVAMDMAKGEYIALLDHDDLLLPNSLYEVAKAINQNPGVDLIYSDEDKVEEGSKHIEPFFKPDWSPDFLHSCNYITHFAVLKAKLMREIGGFSLGTEGAQDWDLLLRFTKKSQRIVHIPKILYSWRKTPHSTAKDSGSKPYAYINQRRVLRDVLRLGGVAVSVLDTKYLGFWRVRYQIQDSPLVSIIIPTKNNYKYLQNCIESIVEKSSYANAEIIIVDTGSTDNRIKKFYASQLVTSNPIKIADWHGQKFNFSAACNFGAGHAKGDYLLFLNDDTEVINSDWMESLLEHAQRKEVGMVGGKLLFANDYIQHAGVVLSQRDIAFHPFYNRDPRVDIFTNIYIENIRNCSAVTAACAMVSASKFEEAGGFDEQLEVTYNDVDLCLRLLEKGYKNVYTPFSELYHFESISIGKITGQERSTSELEKAASLMRKKWGDKLKRDPYYNDNFTQHGPGYDLLETKS